MTLRNLKVYLTPMKKFEEYKDILKLKGFFSKEKEFFENNFRFQISNTSTSSNDTRRQAKLFIKKYSL